MTTENHRGRHFRVGAQSQASHRRTPQNPDDTRFHLFADMSQKITYTEILKLIEDLLASDGIDTKVDEEMQLIGGDSVLDSMKLVELCIALEDKASDIGFEFDWTSDTAMSISRSMFRTAGNLIEEFINQSTAK